MRRRATRLFARIVDPVNIDAAWRATRRGKRRSVGAATFAVREEHAVHTVAVLLAAGRWRPGEYRTWIIRRPKPRLIAAAPFADRVVHHAIHRVLAPVLLRSFITDTYACLPGRGTHRAVLRFQQGLRNFRWVARVDVRRYFLEVDHRIALELIAHRVDDPPLFRLLEHILASGARLYADAAIHSALGLEGAYEPAPGKGLPIGNLTSQLVANVYLDGADHFAKRVLGVPLYLRYMDDMVLFGDHHGELCRQVAALIDWLARERRLEARPKGEAAMSTRGAYTFLGYTVDRARRRVAGRTLRWMRARLKAAARSPEDLEALEETLAATIQGLLF